MAVSGLAREGLPVAHDSAADEGDSSDESLAARGDTGCLVVLYRRHFRPVYRYLYVRLGRHEEAEDAAAETWERVLTSLPGYRPTAPFRAWLFTIARRALADHYRRHKGAPQPGAIPLDIVEEVVLDQDAGPEERVIAADEARRALQAVAGLGEEQQEVIALRFMSGLTYGEIAQVLGKKEPAVKMMAYRALADLRRLLGDE
jgi:RNA polymerase sigma-70 factor (ECF subfamily)